MRNHFLLYQYHFIFIDIKKIAFEMLVLTFPHFHAVGGILSSKNTIQSLQNIFLLITLFMLPKSFTIFLKAIKHYITKV